MVCLILRIDLPKGRKQGKRAIKQEDLPKE
jgi:hypothetical protein